MGKEKRSPEEEREVAEEGRGRKNDSALSRTPGNGNKS